MKTSYGLAPLRLGLAGGGTDIPPYSTIAGGAVLNVTIDKFAHTTVSEIGSGLRMAAIDLKIERTVAVNQHQNLRQLFPLHHATYLRFMHQFNAGTLEPLHLQTHVEVPVGSGLGASSALTVSMIKALSEHFRVQLSPHQVAELAWQTERIDCQMPGGWQDQYATTFGGFNLMRSTPSGKISVSEVRPPKSFLSAFEASLLLYFLRPRDRIHESPSPQIPASVSPSTFSAIRNAVHEAEDGSRLVSNGDLLGLAAAINRGWKAKQSLSPRLDSQASAAMQIARRHGMLAGKVCGAGLGGFMMFIVPPHERSALASTLLEEGGGFVTTANVHESGATSWSRPTDRSKDGPIGS
jgi:D-glycero-alpha-D-manno-heptose-7-phosphate kinase